MRRAARRGPPPARRRGSRSTRRGRSSGCSFAMVRPNPQSAPWPGRSTLSPAATGQAPRVTIHSRGGFGRPATACTRCSTVAQAARAFGRSPSASDNVPSRLLTKTTPASDCPPSSHWATARASTSRDRPSGSGMSSETMACPSAPTSATSASRTPAPAPSKSHAPVGTSPPPSATGVHVSWYRHSAPSGAATLAVVAAAVAVVTDFGASAGASQ